ncbi:MAG TPA: hypothetical protein VLG36_02555 [Candidatus Chromulinivoraceae bacterium]|nr:hypothetical protein [Candidatus Chromulinivoraceae bacterium]
MKKILYIGGVGSDSHLVDALASALATQFDVNVMAMSFSEAYKNNAQVARLVPECLVITHSTGMVLLKNMAPKELIAIAPPMPSLPSLLLWRSFPKTIALIASGRESIDRPQKLLAYHLHFIKEHILRPYLNNALVREIGAFDAAQQAVEMVRCGSKVTLGFMENDKLFPQAATHPHLELAKDQGVTIVDMILGHHDEFVLYPTEVLAQLDQGSL